MLFSVASGALYEFLASLGIPGIVTLVLGGPAIAALVTYLLGRHKPELEKKDADLATAERTQGMSLALAARLEGEIERISGELKEVRELLKVETGEREKLAETVREYKGIIYALRVQLSRIEQWWEDEIVARWDEVRAKDNPPRFPHSD